MRRPLRDIAAAQHGAFSTAQAAAVYSRGELRARVRSGRRLEVFTGTYRVSSGAAGPRLRLSAACLSLGRQVPACLHSAAELHGFGGLDPVTHVAVRPGEACAHRADLWPQQFGLAAGDVVRLRCGLLATTADRTAIDLARTLPRLDVFPVLDAALTAGVWSPESLAAELRRHAGLRGVRQARELGPRAPWQDLGWEEEKAGLEYDGREAHDGPDNLRADRRRHNVLQDDDRAMFHATDLDVYRDSAELMRKVGAAMDRRSRAPGRWWISNREHPPVISAGAGAPPGGSASAAT